MADLFTLRAASGLPADPPALGTSTLIMIDCQNTYTRGPLELDGVQAALDQAEELLDRARWRASRSSTSSTTPAPARPTTSREEIAAIVDRVAPRAGRADDRQELPQLVLPAPSSTTVLKTGTEAAAACSPGS